MKTRFLLVLLSILVGGVTQAQKTLQSASERPVGASQEYQIDWKGGRTEVLTEELSLSYLYFEGATFRLEESFLPRFYLNKTLPAGTVNAQVRLINQQYEALDPAEQKWIRAQDLPKITSSPDFLSKVTFQRKAPILYVDLLPLRKNPSTGQLEKLVAFDLEITPEQGLASRRSGSREFASSSVLGSGDWFKIGVTEDGVCKISYSVLEALGMDIANLNPTNLRVFGNGGGMLPRNNSAYRHDDLKENAIYIEGESDGVFNRDDYILFYAQGPHQWAKTGSVLSHEFNLFSDTSYYFITANYFGPPAKRIQPAAALSNSAQTITEFDDRDFYERDLVNLISSGKEWYGEQFNAVTTYDFLFNFPNVVTTSQVRLKTNVVARTIGGNSTFSINAGNLGSDVVSISGVPSGYINQYANAATSEFFYTPTSNRQDITLTFNKGNSSAVAWLNYLEIQARRRLILAGDQMMFRDLTSVGNGDARYVIGDWNPTYQVWDITDPVNVASITITTNGGNGEFIAPTDSLKEFIAFSNEQFITPYRVGRVPIQNLHALPGAEFTIVAPAQFLNQAERLAEIHRRIDNMTVNVVTDQQIYNEFSSGAQDITAIKDFMRMFYERAGTNPEQLPKYLLLFGDGSYDPKDRISGNTNLLPSYHSNNSLWSLQSYISDDYFGLLDPTESDALADKVDIGIGRFPVKNVQQAQVAVDKVEMYYDTRTLGPWRTYVAFIGDDEDGNVHMRDANILATKVDTSHIEFNIDKIFFDAFQQVSTPGGERYPDVNASIQARMDQGALVLQYVGHGGELGWGHERVLEVPEINSWENRFNQPLFLTATCEFSRFDDPKRTSAGEYVFLNPRGGGIGLLTTTRLVFSTPNFKLAQAFSEIAYSRDASGNYPRLGDLTRLTKGASDISVNTRNFTLLGDPALQLAYPQHKVITTSAPDTIRALERVTIFGQISDYQGNKLTDFNGTVYPTVFDKSKRIETLNNDGIGTFRFNLQESILFKGRASVKNGEFSFTFVVPKDISFLQGDGRISYYAENGSVDAAGGFEDFVIGGVSGDIAGDDQPPTVELYMNNQDFVFGGLTDENPDLFAIVFDSNGINTVGNGIGHDIVAVLDENTSNSIVLNDYYESDLDSYQKGSIRYPFNQLSEGRHTLRLKVWDVHNNSGEAETEFVVASNAKLALEHILNYPNPFTTNTAFYFEHNQPGQNLSVRIQVFTVSGKLVKIIDGNYLSDGFRVGPIQWDGRDDYGDKIGKGVYVYKLQVTAPSGDTVDEFEKLVILN